MTRYLALMGFCVSLFLSMIQGCGNHIETSEKPDSSQLESREEQSLEPMWPLEKAASRKEVQPSLEFAKELSSRDAGSTKEGGSEQRTLPEIPVEQAGIDKGGVTPERSGAVESGMPEPAQPESRPDQKMPPDRKPLPDRTPPPDRKPPLGKAAKFVQTASRWGVPASGTRDGFHIPSSASKLAHWSVVDLNGDKKPDLVQTVDPKTGRLFGGSRGYWKFFLNTGKGFSLTGTQWPVPSSGTPDGFFTFSSAKDRAYWFLMDLNGDKKPDLVQTVDPKTGRLFGGSRGYWKLFLNTGKGFAGSGIRWDVPSSGTSEGFFTIARSLQKEHWAVMDLNGDKKPDLVQTVDPKTGRLFGGSRGYWKLFINTGKGFSLTGTQWPVPSSGTRDGFFAFAQGSKDAYWSLMDLNGDKKPDLVQTVDPKTERLFGGSRGYWKLFINTGKGFSLTGTQWFVPVSGTRDGFFVPASQSGSSVWFVTDLDGDKKLDLVQTVDPKTGRLYGGSRGYWKLFANTGKGFSLTGVSFSVPSSQTRDGFYAPSHAKDKGYWTLMDLTGDERLELVQTVDPKTGRLYGGSRGFWQIFSVTP